MRSRLSFQLKVAATFVLVMLFPWRYRRVLWCLEKHRMGSFLIWHHDKVPCDIALLVARHVQVLWEELREDFPEETQAAFVLFVVHDPYRGPGWKPLHKSVAVINLAAPPSLDVARASFEVRERTLRGTIAEELHHIGRYRKFGEEPYQFRAEYEDGHLGLVFYYALNESEYEALKFCVRTTGDRVDLLEEVEDYRQRKRVGLELRNLFPT